MSILHCQRVISWQEAESPEEENISGLRFLLERSRIISASITTKLLQFCSSLDNILDLSQHQLLINTSLSSGAFKLRGKLSFLLHQVFRDLSVSWSENSDSDKLQALCNYQHACRNQTFWYNTPPPPGCVYYMFQFIHLNQCCSFFFLPAVPAQTV